MGRLIRWHEESFVHFITNRTEHEMFLLLPTREVNELILYWLARAKETKGKHIRLFAFIFMSNHHHMLLQDPEGELAEFMGYFQGNLAKALNKLHCRKGKFWSREYDDVIVDGEDEFWNRYGYIAANPVKAGLVDNPDLWEGVCSVPYVQSNMQVAGVGINQTQYGNASRHGKTVDKEEYTERFCFELATPPMIAGLDRKQITRHLSDVNTTAALTARKNRGDTPCLGMEKVLSQNPLDRPDSPAQSARFKIMAFCESRKKKLHDAYKYFVQVYRSCCQELLIL